MLYRLLKQSWLRLRRSPVWTQSVVQSVFLGFFGLYIGLTMLGLGFVAGKVLDELFPGQDIMILGGAFFLYYCLADILVRYFMQKYPSLEIKPYMVLPIKKRTMAHYLLSRSIGSFFNILPLFFLVPFFFLEILPFYTGFQATGFAVFALGIVIFNNYASFGITKALAFKKVWPASLLVGLLVLFFLEMQGIIGLLPGLKATIALVTSNLGFSVVPFLGAGLIYVLLHQFFVQHFSLEQQQEKRQFYGSNFNLSIFDRFGAAGRIMELEVKLMLRSKRARAYLIMSFLFLLFPAFFFDQETLESPYVLIIWGLIMTGLIALNHGQLMLSWNSLHFDLLMTRGNKIYDIFRGKYYILVIGCLITYALCIPYALIDPNILLFNTVMLLFNISGSILGYMLLASSNSKGIDPNEGGAFNFDGFGAGHYLIAFPLLIVPCGIFLVGETIAGMWGGILFLVVPSLLGVIFHRAIIRWCTNIFMNNRYRISSAFRKIK